MENELSLLKVSEDGKTIIGVHDKNISSITIPCSVTSLGNSSFKGCSSLTSVSIPNSVTSIGDEAFRGCSGLTSIDIPNSVTSIGGRAFEGCSNLTSVTIGSSVTCIGKAAFSWCAKLSSVTIGKSVTIICESAFSYCRSLKYIVIPNNIKRIGNAAFSNCLNLESILISNSLEEIGSFAFNHCENLLSIEIPNGVKSLKDNTFSSCYKLTCVTIPEGVTSIGNETFKDCYRLCSINIPNSLTIIERNAFVNCTALSDIIIPNNVESIGEYAFSYSGLYSVAIPLGVNCIEKGTFSNCKKLISVSIPGSLTRIGKRAFQNCSSLNSFNIPDSVESIEENAFEGCTNLTSINIPDSVTNIKNYAFFGCKNLEIVHIPNSIQTIGEMAFYGCSTKEVFLPILTKYKDNSFDEQTKVTKDKVFISYSWDNEEHFKWVKKLATNLQDVGVDVIFDLWNLKAGSSYTDYLSENLYNSRIVLCILTPNYKYKIDKNEGLIGYEASIIASKMKQNHSENYFMPVLRTGNLNISCPIFFTGRVVLDMRDDDNYDRQFVKLLNAFLGIPAKKKVGFDSLLLIDNDKTILGVTNKSLTSIDIPNSVKNISETAFADCTKLTSVIIPNSVTCIGDRAFSGCINLKTVMIPNSVVKIGNRAFEGCPIREIFLPKSTRFYPNSFDKKTKIENIFNDTFSYDKDQDNRLKQEKESFLKISEDGKRIIGVSNNSLTSIIIPDGVTNIGDSTFSGFNNLTSVSIPDSVTSIGKRAFYMCKALDDIKIKNKVTSIGEEAFRGCSSLTSITIPDSVTSIGEGAFCGCSGLMSIEVNENNIKYDSRDNSKAIIDKNTNELIRGCKNTVIPNSVTSIGNSAFGSCEGLASITIPNSVERIEDSAFKDCTELTSITIGNKVTSIGKYAFSDCSNLTSISIPKSVTSIGDGAFYRCKGLTSVTIPDSVKTIGDGAFYWCTGLTSVTIPDSVKTIGDNAFAHIGILAFIQILANKLKCQYSLSKEQSKQNRVDNFIPYGTVYKEEKPFVIIEMINANDKGQNYNYTEEELFDVQDFLKISWSIIFKDQTIFLRHLYGKKESIEDVFKIVEKINGIASYSVGTLPNDDYLGEIKARLIENLDGVSKKDSLIKFANSLNIDDIEIEEGGIYLTDAKETEFFKYLLSPVEKKELWRYTTKNSLFLTLTSKNQNMLSLNCMNDISEIDYADKYIDRKTCFLRNAINEANKVFILSCCDDTKSDDLMMWRLYAEDGEGISLCYNLDSVIDNKYFYLAYICYGKQNSHPELDYLKGMMKLSLPPHFRFRKWNVWKHFFKPYEFNYEKEIRLIYYEQDKTFPDNTRWIVDNKSGIASPMKLFSLEKKTKRTPSFPLSLSKVLIGPKSKEAEVNRVQFSKMFSEAKIADSHEISISKIDIYR